MSASSLRVLHVTPYFAPAFRYGGPPRSILGLCQTLGRLGADVEVFTTTANGENPLPAAPQGVCYDGVRVRYFPLDWAGIGWHATGLSGALALAARRADLVHVHGLWNATAWSGVRAAQAARIPYVISPRGMLQPDAMNRHRVMKTVAYHAIERRHLRDAALLHATSAAEARRLERFGRGVALVPNGVEAPAVAPDAIARVQRRFNLAADADVVTFLGRLHPIKRLDLLADAFTRLRRGGRHATLVVAGPDEDDHRRGIEPLFRHVREDVRWTGAVDGDDKWALLAASRVVVQCSDSESFGLSVAEALASGAPVVVTVRGAWPQIEAIGAGICAAHDAAAIADAIDRVIGDRPAAAAMGERGCAWVARHFGWDAIGRAMLREYRTLLVGSEAAAS
jgi:glycosyltransferase involved in cell wall biosynthesis